jgi:hypothetical protein
MTFPGALPPVAPLTVIARGIRRGVGIPGGMVAWLPPELWPHADVLARQMREMNEACERMMKLYDAAEQAAFDAAQGARNA